MTFTLDDATTRLLQAAAKAPVTSRSLTLTVEQGPEAGQTFTVEDAAHRQLVVGKASACDFCLTDPSVSRRHVSLELDERGLVLRDLESSNGTEVQGVLITQATLRGGERIKIGGTTIHVQIGAEERVVESSDAGHFGDFVGASPAARRLYPELTRLAAEDKPVLFEGEEGTGKEMLAVALHESSARRSGPFVAFERGDAPIAEAEAALFGRDEKPGLLEQANGGSLFVHEIGDLEASLQLKLLDALERRSVRRIGATNASALDVRVLASTSRDLEREVQERRFREDLLTHIGAARLVVPPLRKRRADIAILTRLFWTQFGGNAAELSPALIQKFEQRSWQGNVRELARTVATHLSATDSLAEAPLDRKRDIVDAVLERNLPLIRSREIVNTEFEQRYLDYVLQQHRGNVSRAAAAAGISRRYFYRLRARE